MLIIFKNFLKIAYNLKSLALIRIIVQEIKIPIFRKDIFKASQIFFYKKFHSLKYFLAKFY